MLYGSGGSGIGGDDTYGTTNPRMRSRVSSQAVLPIVLVGTSLGGAIAAAFTAAYPSEVSRLVLVAPAGLIPISNLPCVSQIHRRGRVGRAVQAVIETCCGCCEREYLVGQRRGGGCTAAGVYSGVLVDGETLYLFDDARDLSDRRQW